MFKKEEKESYVVRGEYSVKGIGKLRNWLFITRIGSMPLIIIGLLIGGLTYTDSNSSLPNAGGIIGIMMILIGLIGFLASLIISLVWLIKVAKDNKEKYNKNGPIVPIISFIISLFTGISYSSWIGLSINIVSQILFIYFIIYTTKLRNTGKWTWIVYVAVWLVTPILLACGLIGNNMIFIEWSIIFGLITFIVQLFFVQLITKHIMKGIA